MLFIGVDHPSIACHDVDKQAAWYCRNLGMKVLASNGKTPPAVLVGYGVLGDAGVELMSATDRGLEAAKAGRFAPGIRHVAFRVSDFDAAYQQLQALGVVFTTEPGEALGGGKTVLFRDPEGNELQIVQRNA